MSAGVPVTPAVEAVGLTKQFGAVHAVSGLSFTVPAGSITGFVGPNGSGKTTTLRMLLGLVTPTSGHSTIAGMPFGALHDPARTVGAALDSLSLHPKRTALAHLDVYAAAIGVPDARAREVLHLVGLESVARQRAGTFSLGMRQRLTLATALLGDPQILVLDEPANGLDPEGIAWLREFLRAFARTGRTVLVSSHLLRELEQTVDRLVIVNRGSLVHQGAIEDLRAQHSARVFVAASDPATLALALGANGFTDAQLMPDGRLAVRGVPEVTVTGIAVTAGVHVFGITTEHVDLEQVFLAMTAGQYAAPQFPAQQQYGPPAPYPPGQFPGGTR
ncbi:ABC transporter ATP-binding protein [Rhodococcus sp. NPDC003318]|uniref:ABC transporter ATP-binding protein n=1 Tax=Rhodococcus sp. NPDC003318 TaxID=3364503 RepID=UPI0036BF4DDD